MTREEFIKKWEGDFNSSYRFNRFQSSLDELLKERAEEAFGAGQNSKMLDKVYRNPKGMRTDKIYPCRLQIIQTFTKWHDTFIKGNA